MTTNAWQRSVQRYQDFGKRLTFTVSQILFWAVNSYEGVGFMISIFNVTISILVNISRFFASHMDAAGDFLLLTRVN